MRRYIWTNNKIPPQYHYKYIIYKFDYSVKSFTRLNG